MLAPGRHGIGLVESHRGRDGLPESLHVGLTEHHLGPAGIRRRDDHPVEEPVQHEREVDRARVVGIGPCDEHRVEPGEQVRLGIARELDDRGARLAPGSHPVEEVLGRVPELLFGAELDRGLPQVEVADDR
jgi:hypothetical protein